MTLGDQRQVGIMCNAIPTSNRFKKLNWLINMILYMYAYIYTSKYILVYTGRGKSDRTIYAP